MMACRESAEIAEAYVFNDQPRRETFLAATGTASLAGRAEARGAEDGGAQKGVPGEGRFEVYN
jgi:hypothetical protein